MDSHRTIEKLKTDFPHAHNKFSFQYALIITTNEKIPHQKFIKFYAI